MHITEVGLFYCEPSSIPISLALLYLHLLLLFRKDQSKFLSLPTTLGPFGTGLEFISLFGLNSLERYLF